MSNVRLIPVAIVAALAFPVAASAQETVGWSAFAGCWRAQGAPTNERLCIEPDGNGVRLTTMIDGSPRGESRVVADDRARDITQDDCRGTERARWSSDRRRVFLNATMSCGDTRRTSSGLMAFTDQSHWVSVQAVTINGETSTRKTVYESTDRNSLTMSDVRSWAASSPSQSAVSEASNYVDDAVIEEWLNSAEREYRVSSGSALDMMQRGPSTTVVVERDRPVYVDRTVYVDRPAVRIYTCWDFFWGCDRYYFRPYVVRYPTYRYYSRPIIIHRDNNYRDYNYRDYNYRDRDRDRDRDRHYERGGSVTRDGYKDRREAQPRSQTVTQTSSRSRETASSSRPERSSSNSGSSRSGSSGGERTAKRR